MNPHYYIWWAVRPGMRDGGSWVPWQYLTDEQIWRYEEDVQRGTPGVTKLYRWMWTGSEWQYDDRSAITVYVHSGEQKYATFWP